jgi:hypothetical protein
VADFAVVSTAFNMVFLRFVFILLLFISYIALLTLVKTDVTRGADLVLLIALKH